MTNIFHEIHNWTHDNQMALNRYEMKYKVVNFTKKCQFNTRIGSEDIILQKASTCNLLGVTFDNELSPKEKTQNLIVNGHKCVFPSGQVCFLEAL